MPAVGRRGKGDEVVTWVSVAVFKEKAQAFAGLAKGIEPYPTSRFRMQGHYPASLTFLARGEKQPLDDRRVGVPCAVRRSASAAPASGYAPRHSVLTAG